MQTTRFQPTSPSSIGAFEQLAGIEDRATFWRPYTPLDKIDTQLYIDSALQVMDKLIRQRVKNGELTLLCDLDASRDRRSERMRSWRKLLAVAA